MAALWIAPTLARIFDPFFTTKPEGLTDVGRSFVHGFVESCRAAVVVDTEVGKGNSLPLYFPVVSRRQARAESRQAEDAGRRVLSIDDEKASAFLTKRMLERAGYRVTSSLDATAALCEFRRRPQDYDVVVTDLALQGADGWAVAQDVLPVRPDLTVVITSGYVAPRDQERARSLGVRGLVPKSESMEQLSRLLDEMFTTS